MIFSGKYEVIEKIGHGGQGVVYRVRRLDFDDMILALKVLPHNLSQEPDLVARFKQEAKVMFGLHHNNIVRVYDFAKDEETYYLTMEYLAGLNLREHLRAHVKAAGGGLPLSHVLTIGAQIADALAYAHEQADSVVHRDIKPSNIIICEGTQKAVVTDFGIAKVLVEQQSDISRFGFVGTPPYCPPEQLRHDKELDGRVDIYALGMVLYECYTGRRFIPPEWSDNEVIARIGYGTEENQINLPDAPPLFVQVLGRAIARDREDRFATAGAFTAALRECLATLASPGPAPADRGDLTQTQSIEAQIRALERKRVHRDAEKARETCRKARTTAEEAGAPVEAATEFGRAVERQREAEERFEHKDNQPAQALFREAAAAFESAAVRSEGRRAARRVDEAREAMLASQREAVGARAAELASDAWAHAEAVAAEAAEAASRGEYARATAQFGVASDAYRGAADEASRAHELSELRAAMAAIGDVRAAAEDAEARTLAVEEFAAAERDRTHLEQALASGQVTVARDMLARTREGFEAAARKAAEARLKAAEVRLKVAAESARQRMDAAAAAAREAAAEEFAAEEFATGRRHAEAADAAMKASRWQSLSSADERATEAFGRAAELARERREAARARATLAEARAAMETAQQAAAEAGAPDEAATLVGRAVESSARGDANATADPAAAAGDYHRAADEYAEAAVVARKRIRRRVVEQVLQEAREAGARARAAGCESVPSFAAAERSLDEAERALAADDLERSADAANAALAAFGDAERELEIARQLDAADRALERLDALRQQARDVGAEAAAPEDYQSAERASKEARERRRAADADGVLSRVRHAEKDYAASIAAALKRARSECTAAKEASLKAGVAPEAVTGAHKSERDAERHRSSGTAAAAAASFRAAAQGYAAATEEVRVRAAEARERALEAKRTAQEHEAERYVTTAFAAASKTLAAAEAPLADQRFAEAARIFSEAAAAYQHLLPAVDLSRARAAAMAARTAAEDARSAAVAANAGDLAKAAFDSASRETTVATDAFTAERFADAQHAFERAAAGFADARGRAEAASRLRARAAERRDEAKRAAAAAGRGGADLAAAEIAAAAGILADAERAYAASDFAKADSEFARAAGAFQEAEIAAETRRARRAAEAAAVRARAMGDAVRRLPRAQAPSGLRARGRLRRADRSLARGDSALSSGDFATARSCCDEAASLYTAMLPERWDDDATRTVVVAPPAPPRRTVMVATVGTVLVLAIATAIGVHEMQRPTRRPTSMVTPGSDRPHQEEERAKDSGTILSKVKPAQTPAAIAAAPTVALPAGPEPPRIRSYDPVEQTVRLTKGATAKLGIQLADASDAAYEWQVDGRKTDDSSPAVRIPVGGPGSHKVTVVARTRGGDVSHSWDLAVAPPPPPVVTRLFPAKEDVEISADRGSRFQIAAKSADNERLAYAWSVDDKNVGTDAPSLDFTAREEDEGSHRVKVDVTDEAKQTASLSWKVTVPFVPITVAQQPQQNVLADVGKETELVAVAKVGDRRDFPLAYRWSLNGKPVPSATGPRFAYQMRASDAQVQVVVSAPGRKSVTANWKLQPRTVAAASPAPPVAVAAVPPPPVTARPPSSAVDASERELKEWIEAYRSAYQNKNIDRLIALGVVPPSEREHMERVFRDLDDLHVEVTDPTIKVDPDGTATVVFTRKDTFKGGNSNPPVRITKSLRKRDGAWVAR